MALIKKCIFIPWWQFTIDFEKYDEILGRVGVKTEY